MWLGLSALLAVVLVIETVQLYWIIDGQVAIGTDLDYYRFVAQRWLDTGVYYTEEQLRGPFVVQTLIHNLYPPHALYLFVPFLVLPDLLWWALPLGLLAYVVWWCRPEPWAWPLLLILLIAPKSPAQILFGNTDMWVVAFLAGAVRWSWPGVLLSFKPSLVFFGVVGILARSWWIAAAALAVVSLPMLDLWLDYPTVLRNSSAQVSYSFGNVPFFLVPIVAWLASARRGPRPMREWILQLIGRRRGTNREAT